MSSEKKKCENCGHEVSADAGFCTNCGKPFTEDKENLYCTKCGALLSEDMNFCTKCGTSVSKNGINQSSEPQIAFTLPNKLSGRLIMKILLLIMIICFFCPMFMFSCYGTEVVRMSGMEMAAGMDVMGEEMEGSMILLLLLLLPIVAFVFLFVKNRQRQFEKMAVNLGGASGLSLIMVCRILLNGLKESENMDYEYASIALKPLLPFYLYILASIAIVVLGIYLQCQYELEQNRSHTSEEKSIYVKCVLSVLGSIMICTGIFMVLFLW